MGRLHRQGFTGQSRRPCLPSGSPLPPLDPQTSSHHASTLPTQYIRPLYRALYGRENMRQVAVETFQKNLGMYHPIAAKMVATDLHLGEESAEA